jgi:FMN-dependent NADH-azoreductase
MNVLHLDSSIQGENSVSRALSTAVVDRIRATESDVSVTYRDLAASPLSHLTLDVFGGSEGQEILAEFQSADIIVIGAGLYNFTIPSQLKAWFDRILVAGQTFQYGADGPEGLAGDKRVIVALARGGVYSEGSPFSSSEHAETLLRTMLGFIGIAALKVIVAEGVALGDEARRSSIATAYAQIEGIRAPVMAS